MSAAPNKIITLRARPTGWVGPEHFELQTRTEPALAETSVASGQVVLRTLYLSVDPYMRGRMNSAKSYVAPFELGQPIESGGIGQVLAAGPGTKLGVGDVVAGMLPWQERCTLDAKGLRPVLPQVSLPAQLGILGMPGMTAYVGLLEIGRPQRGETVFVSAAAGAVGSTVGQLAKLHGCRVVGSAGSDEKVRYLIDELGFDAAFNYKTTSDLRAQLGALCPDGIDVYFDNVGGAQLEAALWLVNVKARIPVCGMISQYNDSEPPPGPRNLNQLVSKRVLMQGFLVTDHSANTKQFAIDMGRWLAEGKLKHHETIIDGFERAPEAFIALLRGANTGKMVVHVASPVVA